MAEPGKLFITGMRVLPKKTLSKTMRRLAAVRSQMAVRRFAARYGLAVDEAERPLEEYESVLDLFTRRLRPDARPVDADPGALVSPVDGTYLVGGPVGDGELVQAKGRYYTLDALLAEEGAASAFAGGSYVTVYLSPRDYHRIHSPVDGVIRGWTHVPGTLFPVNAAAVAHVDRLFARNERIITHIDSEVFGRVAVVKVGATNVGHITLAYDDSVRTNVGDRALHSRGYETPIPIRRGQELGVFELGSTVIVVTEQPLDLEGFEGGQHVQMGTRLGGG